jgi:large subunit ribosomal protein L4
MASAVHYSAQGEEIGQVELPARIFEAPIREHAIWEVVRAYRANQRLGTAKVKTRAEVRGGGRKPYRQKGTGRARRGTIRSPIARGGGRAFGPKPRSYRIDLPRKVRASALRSALSARARDAEVRVIDRLEFEAPRTRDMASILGRIGLGERRCLLVLGDHDRNAYLSSRNIPNLETITLRDLNTYAVMRSETVLFEGAGLEQIEEVLRV